MWILITRWLESSKRDRLFDPNDHVVTRAASVIAQIMVQTEFRDAARFKQPDRFRRPIHRSQPSASGARHQDTVSCPLISFFRLFSLVSCQRNRAAIFLVANVLASDAQYERAHFLTKCSHYGKKGDGSTRPDKQHGEGVQCASVIVAGTCSPWLSSHKVRHPSLVRTGLAEVDQRWRLVGRRSFPRSTPLLFSAARGGEFSGQCVGLRHTCLPSLVI